MLLEGNHVKKYPWSTDILPSKILYYFFLKTAIGRTRIKKKLFFIFEITARASEHVPSDLRQSFSLS